MKLSVKGWSYASGLLFGLLLFLAGIINLIWPSYGVAFLDVAKSIYPGYGAMSGFVGVIVGTIYAIVDGVICGALLAWLYNKFAAPGGAPAA